MQIVQADYADALDPAGGKLTLEVLQSNASAQRLYARYGFASYALAPALGQFAFLQKWL